MSTEDSGFTNRATEVVAYWMNNSLHIFKCVQWCIKHETLSAAEEALKKYVYCDCIEPIEPALEKSGIASDLIKYALEEVNRAEVVEYFRLLPFYSRLGLLYVSHRPNNPYRNAKTCCQFPTLKL